MQPTTVQIGGGPNAAFRYTTPEEKAQVLKDVYIPGTTQVSLWNGHEFEAVTPEITDYGDGHIFLSLQEVPTAEYQMQLYYPIDPRIELVDVKGALRAYANQTNDGWLFEHRDEDAMSDHEDVLEAVAVSKFTSEIDGAQVKVNEATNAVARGRVVTLHRLLTEFRDDVVATVVASAREKHIGWYDQNPHAAHVHMLVRTAIANQVTAWQTDRSADYSSISAAIGRIFKALTSHDYERRWDKAARIAAEMAALDAKIEGTETEGE